MVIRKDTLGSMGATSGSDQPTNVFNHYKNVAKEESFAFGGQNNAAAAPQQKRDFRIAERAENSNPKNDTKPTSYKS